MLVGGNLYHFRWIRFDRGGCYNSAIHEQTTPAWLPTNEIETTSKGIQTRKQKVGPAHIKAKCQCVWFHREWIMQCLIRLSEYYEILCEIKYSLWMTNYKMQIIWRATDGELRLVIIDQGYIHCKITI